MIDARGINGTIVSVPVKILGGNGDDLLYGGLSTDTLFGERSESIPSTAGTATTPQRRALGMTTLRGARGGHVPPSPYLPGFYTTDPENIREDTPADMPVAVSGSYLTEWGTTDSPFDVDQQNSPTCAFLASLAAVASETGTANDLVSRIRYDATRDLYGIPFYVKGSTGQVQVRTVRVNGDWTERRDPGGGPSG